MPFRGYGAQSGLGGFAEGLNSGLRNIAVIRGIQKSQEDEARGLRGEERAGRQEARQVVEQSQRDTTFGQQQAEYKRLHDRTIDPATVIDGLGLDDEGKQYIQKAVKPFLPEGGKVSLADLTTIRDNVLKDPKVMSEINNHRRRSLGNQITAMEEELSTIGGEGGGLGQVAQFNQKKAVLDQAKARMQELDPNYFKREELRIKEKTAEKDTVPSTAAGLRGYGLKHGKPEYIKQAEAVEKAEQDKENIKVTAAEKRLDARLTASEERAVKRQEEADKKAATKSAADRVNKYYPELKKSLEDERKQLKEESPDHPDIPVIDRALQKLSTHHSRDLEYIAQGKEPPGIRKLEEWRAGGATQETAPRMTPPKEGETYVGKKGKYTFRGGKWGLETK